MFRGSIRVPTGIYLPSISDENQIQREINHDEPLLVQLIHSTGQLNEDLLNLF